MLLLFYSTHKKDVWKCIIKFIKNVLARIDTHFVPHMDSIVLRHSRDGSSSCFIWLWFYTQRAVRESIYNDINLTGVIVKFKTVLSSSFYPSSLDLFIVFYLCDLYKLPQVNCLLIIVTATGATEIKIILKSKIIFRRMIQTAWHAENKHGKPCQTQTWCCDGFRPQQSNKQKIIHLVQVNMWFTLFIF